MEVFNLLFVFEPGEKREVTSATVAATRFHRSYGGYHYILPGFDRTNGGFIEKSRQRSALAAPVILVDLFRVLYVTQIWTL